jgi:L-alanine-DL-glutamate epimerase-like enolase superfamily enzyme
MPDATIKAITTTILRVPWPQTQWLRGHPFGDTRDLVVLDLETSDGIAGMGYLFLFAPTMKTITACLEEVFTDKPPQGNPDCKKAIKLGSSAFAGWTPERSRCGNHTTRIRARLGPDRLLQTECLGH